MGLCYLFHLLILRLSLYLNPVNQKVLSTAGLMVIAIFLIIPIRGGIQQIPINQSSVYFSRHNFANVSAINAAWNFIYSLSKNRDTHNPYQYIETAKAKQIADSLYNEKGNGVHILTTSKPNVIIIVWESFTEKAIHASVNGIEVTPHFNELKNEGIYFSQIYASGDRTDKGIAAVLSGYPALNNFSIIHQPKKSASLTGLPVLFKNKGYHTSFYYGGESEFANLKSYLLQSKFDRFTDKNDYSAKDQNSKWGAHDGIVAERILNDIEKDTGSYFTSWLTLSSHEPFEIPVAPAFSGNSETSLFMNSLHYTDEVIYQLVEKLKQRPDWDKTLVIIVADHGHPLIDPSTTVDNRKIPMLWLGGALKEKGIVARIGSQLDLATSLEQQLNPGSDLFPFSRNLFDSSAGQWAYFSFNDGFGLVQPGKTLVYDNVGKQISFSKGAITKRDLEMGMALQQFFYDDYLRR
jgi:phosphoglycerol transferase MdoB-like AlkP superfamily enzyme